MPIDLRAIKSNNRAKRVIDPIELFHALKISDPTINDLWLAQGDALKEWHANRGLTDIAIKLNTGAGKTLVGLLAAQSLVNETSGHVLYACSSIQLVDQTAKLARGYGLSVTAYVQGKFTNDFYQRGLAPCVTTYQALFNGKSRFFREDLAAIIFDDAHTADHLLRDHFSLKIRRDIFPEQFAQVAALFQGYHTRIGNGVGYRQTIDQGDSQASWFVPPFALYANLEELQRLLLGADLGEAQDTMFAWEHLRDHLDVCTLFVSGQEIVLTPPLIPVRTLPYFQKRVRRLYMSATLATADVFLRTFGQQLNHTIAPATTAGECERLILMPHSSPACTDGEDIPLAKALLDGNKALILVPSYYQARKWEDVAEVSEGDVAARVEAFKKSKDPEHLLLVGRYDGVDFPGDACRFLVIDTLPTGLGPLERYLWEKLTLIKVLRSAVASRIVQSFGRISRGTGDYGVVVLTGTSLIYWLLDPKNLSLLPPFLCRQLELGMQISKRAHTLDDLADMVRRCLFRDPEWLYLYQSYGDEDNSPTSNIEMNDAEALAIAKTEVDFGHELWDRNFGEAAKILNGSIDKVFKASTSLGAWHRLWLGYCYERMRDKTAAIAQYNEAHNAMRVIPAYDVEVGIPGNQDIPLQILEVARYLHGDLQLRRYMLDRFEKSVAALAGSKRPGETEEALRALGEYLGLSASRPDKEFGTGPDVLWDAPGSPALCAELKTDKGPDRPYYKRDVSRMYDHIQWVRDNSTSRPILATFVGPLAPAAEDANPGQEIILVELSQFQALAERLRSALADICAQATVADLSTVVFETFRQRGLLWPELFNHLSKHVLREL